MNRTDGLVRRNKTRNDNGGSEGGNSSNAQSVDENDVILNDGENNIDDIDSKETRLTLMEEVLLLGLKDKEVKSILSSPFFSSSSYNYVYVANRQGQMSK